MKEEKYIQQDIWEQWLPNKMSAFSSPEPVDVFQLHGRRNFASVISVHVFKQRKHP